MQTNNQAFPIVFRLSFLTCEDAQVLKDGEMVALGNERVCHIVMGVEVRLKSCQHVLNFKTVLSLYIKGMSKGLYDLTVCGKSKKEGLCKLGNVLVGVVAKRKEMVIQLLIIPHVVAELNLLVEFYLSIVFLQIAAVMQVQ
jgi:hypothetical protein